MRLLILSVLAFATAIGSGNQAMAQSGADAATTEFVEKARDIEMFSVRAGAIAAREAESNDVRLFGQKVIVDYRTLRRELKRLAKQDQLQESLPVSIEQERKEKLRRLTDLSGIEFDREYLQMQVQTQKRAADLFEEYSQMGENPALREWAKEAVPTIREHLTRAQDLQSELG